MITAPPSISINILELYGCYFDTSTIVFLKTLFKQSRRSRLDILIDKKTITIHKEAILMTLDEAPTPEAWNELETVWEMLEARGFDFLEIPADLCCHNPNCVNRKYN